MREMMSAQTLRSRMERFSKNLNQKTKKGNVRGIGVGAVQDESKSAQISRNKARILTKMSPSLQRGLQILAGMISCPEGGTRTNLLYSFGEVDGVSNEKINQLIAILKNYFENHLDYENKLHDTIYTVLAETGADVEVYLPLTLVDEVLGLESDGYCGTSIIPEGKNPIKYNENHLAISNDMSLLSRSHIPLATVPGLESEEGGRSFNRLTRISKTALAINKSNVAGKDGVVVRKGSSASIIPIIYNGRVLKYIALLDDYGNFIERTENIDFIDLMTSSTDSGEATQYEILGADAGILKDKSINGTNGFDQIRRSIEDDVILAITGQVKGESEDQRNARIEGLIDGLGEENIIDILTARAMAAKKTRVVLLDPSYVSYFSLIENDNGRGITVIEENSSILLLHVTLLYAKILSELESSVPHTRAEAVLSEEDWDGDVTLKDILGELAMSNAPDYKLDYSGTSQLFRSLNRMNTTVKVSNANVPGMPNMDINVERSQKEVRGPSMDVLSEVGKYATQSIGISAEYVDNSYSEKFKLQVARDNDITARQMAMYLSTVNEKLTDRGRKRIAHNDELWTELLAVLGNNEKAENNLIELLATFSITLPEATAVHLEGFSQDMDTIVRALEAYFDKALPDTVIEGGERIDSESLRTMREIVVGSMIRSYAMRTGMFDGMGIDPTSMDGIASIINSELEAYGDSFGSMVKGIKKYNKSINKAEGKVNGQDEEEETPQADDNPPVDDPTPSDDLDVPSLDDDPSLGDNPPMDDPSGDGTPEGDGGDDLDLDLDDLDLP